MCALYCFDSYRAVPCVSPVYVLYDSGDNQSYNCDDDEYDDDDDDESFSVLPWEVVTAHCGPHYYDIFLILDTRPQQLTTMYILVQA